MRFFEAAVGARARAHDWRDGQSGASIRLPEASAAQDLRRKTHETIGTADDDFGRRLQFNTVVSSVMELCNAVSRFDAQDDNDRGVAHEALSTAVLVISPIAPHIAHSLWQTLGHTDELVGHPWPEVDEDALVQASIEMVVQVQGKVRGKIQVPAEASDEEILALAKAESNVARHLEGKTIRKEIVVPGKLANIVVG